MSVFGDKLLVAGIDRVAATFSVPKLVLGHIHYVPGNRPYSGVRSGARAWSVLFVLISGFPQQAKCKTGLPALLRMLHQAVHLVLCNTATYGESTVHN